LALVADRFLSSWFLRLSGFFGCYQGHVVATAGVISKDHETPMAVSCISNRGGRDLAVIYMASILIELPFKWTFALCWSSIVTWVWMVIRILKDPYSTGKTFDEYFTGIVRIFAAMERNSPLLVLFAQAHMKLRGRFESEP